MFWMPILFICLQSGECIFMTKDSVFDERQCNESVKESIIEIKRTIPVGYINAACIPAKPPTT